MSEQKPMPVNREVRRYYIARNRDFERVMSPIEEPDKRFIKIPEDEWVRAIDYDALHAAARALVEKIDAIHASPDYEAVWALAGNRGLPYRGPNYSGELQGLRAILGECPTPSADPAPQCKQCGQFLDSRGKCRVPEHNV